MGEKGFPQNGFMGNAPNNLERGFEISLGGYNNWDNINKNLHPGIDISGIYDIGIQYVTREFDNRFEDNLMNPSDWYRVDYGNYFGFWMGWGIGTTLKPAYIAELETGPLDHLLIDIGLRADLLFYGSGITTIEIDDLYFDDPNDRYDFERELDMEMLGMRIDRHQMPEQLVVQPLRHISHLNHLRHAPSMSHVHHMCKGSRPRRRVSTGSGASVSTAWPKPRLPVIVRWQHRHHAARCRAGSRHRGCSSRCRAAAGPRRSARPRASCRR
jgi:hypothetical protein